jgi:hypothetical protein
MAIGNCDCCDRTNVPGSVVNCPGEPFACFICQGDDDADPYGEREIDCTCDGEGCGACSGCGTVWIATEPVTLDDIEEITHAG